MSIMKKCPLLERMNKTDNADSLKDSSSVSKYDI